MLLHDFINCPALIDIKQANFALQISNRISPSTETHLAMVRGLPTKKFLTKCTNRSSQQCQVLSQY